MAIFGSTARRQLALEVVLTALVVATCGAVLCLMPQAGVDRFEAVLRQARAAILFGAAALGLLSGRWGARISVGFASATLLVLALTGAVSATSMTQTGLGRVTSTGVAAFAVLLLLAAAAAPEVNDAASFRRLLKRESCSIALLALIALIPVVNALLAAGSTMPMPLRMAFSALVATGWLVAGSRVLRIDLPELAWLPSVLRILAVAAVVRAFLGVWAGFSLVMLGLDALAGTFALGAAAMAARTTLISATTGMTRVLADLDTMRDNESGRRAEEIERLHEVRSVLAGLRAATGSLRKYEDSLDPGVRRRLEDAVGAELSRLNRLIDPGAPATTEEADLEAAVMPVVVAERAQGLVVTTDLVDVSARGRSAEIATLVSDLLVNARVHAPGSPVRLTARVDSGVITLEVRDWGPGLSATETGHVFERSYRGARPLATGVGGSGLGLHNARKLARRLQGDLHVRAPLGGGCCFVATLPLTPEGDDQLLESLGSQWRTDQDTPARGEGT